MNYYIDTEFHEYHKQQKILGIKIGKPIPTIDLISIGIVSEDGREYYAISKDFNIKDAWNSWQPKKHSLPMGTVKEYWLRENVLKPIFDELLQKQKEFLIENDIYYSITIYNDEFTLENLENLIDIYGKTNKQIAKEIKEFVAYEDEDLSPVEMNHPNYTFNEFKFYAYYADYDWVVFCQLFGKMIDLPKGFPMYCIDLKQEMDNIYENKKKKWKKSQGNFINKFSKHKNYPKQKNKHNALDDAKWNKKLHKFLKQL